MSSARSNRRWNGPAGSGGRHCRRFEPRGSRLRARRFPRRSPRRRRGGLADRRSELFLDPLHFSPYRQRQVAAVLLLG